MGMSALCGYQRDVLPADVLGDLAAIHPTANSIAEAGPVPPLRRSRRARPQRRNRPLLEPRPRSRALDHAHVPGEPTSLDLEPLEFIDHHGFEVLAAHTRRLAVNGGYSIRNPPRIVNRLGELLEMGL